jgi:hypothetical protein
VQDVVVAHSNVVHYKFCEGTEQHHAISQSEYKLKILDILNTMFCLHLPSRWRQRLCCFLLARSLHESQRQYREALCSHSLPDSDTSLYTCRHWMAESSWSASSTASSAAQTLLHFTMLLVCHILPVHIQSSVKMHYTNYQVWWIFIQMNGQGM